MNQGEKPIRIMLIDDHRTMLWGLERLIETATPSMQVVATATGCMEALAAVPAQAPNVILLDVDLGEESGLDILPALVANRQSRVLILTGTRDQELLDSAIVLGARGVLRKDAPAAQLLKAIEKVHHGELWLDQETLGRVLGTLTLPATLTRPTPAVPVSSSLTARELKIVQTVVVENGAPNRRMAEKLFISEHTLRNHLSSIYQKLGVRNRLELYVYAVKHGLGAMAPSPTTVRGTRRPSSPAVPPANSAIRFS